MTSVEHRQDENGVPSAGAGVLLQPSPVVGPGPVHPPSVRDVVECVLDAYVVGEPVRDRSGRIIDFATLEANSGACASIGLPRHLVIGARVRALFPNEFAERLIHLVGDVVDSGRALSIDDYPYPSPLNGGAIHRYDVRATALDGRVACTWRDVTSRFAERQQFETMLANSADVVLLVADGTVEWVSAGVTDLLGWSVDEVIGAPCDQMVHPADRDRRHGPRSEGAPHGIDRVRLRYLCKGGGSVWCEARTATMDGRSGRATVISLRDVTDAMDVEDSRDRSEERYRLVAENASDVVYTTDRMYQFNWVSPSVEGILGWAPGELVGIPTATLLLPEDLDTVAGLRRRVFGEGLPVGPVNLRYRMKQGGYRWMSMRAHYMATAPEASDGHGGYGGMVVTLRDIEGEVLERRATDTLAAGNALLAVAEDESALLGSMCETAVDVGGYAFAWYGRWDRGPGGGNRSSTTGEVRPVASSHAARDYLADLEVRCDAGPLSQGTTGEAVRTGSTVVEPDLAGAPRYDPWHERAEEFGFRSCVSLPVRVGGAMDGVLTVYASECQAFDDHAQAVLTELVRTLGFGLERLRDRGDLRQAFVSSIDLVAAVVESRDPYTAGHQALVAELARAIGTDLGLDEHRLDGLALAARIHDVGKIGVPIDILCRPGALNCDELAVVRRHATIGWEIAGHFTWPWPVADIVHQHHEQFDGSGYPQGLRGEDILLEARIVSVADCYQAIASRRPYRDALGEDFAYRTIVEGAGTQFDPDVVAAFVRVIDAGFTFSKAQPGQG